MDSTQMIDLGKIDGNALNIANAFYVKVCQETDKELDELRDEQAKAINGMIKSSMTIAGTMLKRGWLAALSNGFVIAGSGKGIWDSSGLKGIPKEERKAILTRVGSQTALFQALGPELTEVQRTTQESLQQKNEAVKAVNDQNQQQFGNCFDSFRQTLKGFLDINYLSGLVALGQVQLR